MTDIGLAVARIAGLDTTLIFSTDLHQIRNIANVIFLVGLPRAQHTDLEKKLDEYRYIGSLV